MGSGVFLVGQPRTPLHLHNASRGLSVTAEFLN